MYVGMVRESWNGCNLFGLSSVWINLYIADKSWETKKERKKKTSIFMTHLMDMLYYGALMDVSLAAFQSMIDSIFLHEYLLYPSKVPKNQMEFRLPSHSNNESHFC